MDTYHKAVNCCLHCSSEELTSIGSTEHGYERFKCLECGRKFNERSATPFNRLAPYLTMVKPISPFKLFVGIFDIS